MKYNNTNRDTGSGLFGKQMPIFHRETIIEFDNFDEEVKKKSSMK